MRNCKWRREFGVLQTLAVTTVLAALLTTGFHGDCRADPVAQPSKEQAAAQARWANTPTSYIYNPQNGTLDEQSRAAIDAKARESAIAGHGRSDDQSKSGMYAIAALLFAAAGLVVWRRARANA
jgi:hypothetical protein